MSSEPLSGGVPSAHVGDERRQPKRAPVPPLEIRYPLCPICGCTVDHDGDGFVCYCCAAYWSDRTVGVEEGDWTEPDAPQCASTDGRCQPGGRWYESGKSYRLEHSAPVRCLLAGGHDGPHRNDGAEWATEDDSRHVAARLRKNNAHV